jgi:site-specific DNA recombinase
MQNNSIHRNAVAAIRVSTTGQGTDGDSPEAQKEQAERYAAGRGATIKKFFVFLESASKELQPMQEAIDYCIDPKNEIDLFIVKSIDRFTRGGSFSYDSLKKQLDDNNVSLVDIYGVISDLKINTLDHLGVSYKWSVYSPTKKAEMLEAERANDEIRDIMSRMIGAEIRYARMGYWVRRAPFGYESEKIETQNGKRCILKPHPVEARWITKMFELRARGTHDDRQIVEEINKLGCKTRIESIRDKRDRTKVIAQRGGKPMTLKTFWRCIENPVYAGINPEKWTQGKPVKCKFDGLVSIELFNQANRGKTFISEQDGEITISKKAPAPHLVNKGIRTPEFPYKKHVMCSHCEKPLYGSASRGKLGKYYAAYHCGRGHYFRVPRKEFNETIESFVKNIQISPEYVEALTKAVLAEWERREAELHKDDQTIDIRISELKGQAQAAADKIKYLNSEVAIKYMEEELVSAEEQIKELNAQKEEKIMSEKPMDMKVVMDYIKYFLEHLEYLLLQQMNPVAKAGYFGVLFDKAPTYEEIKFGTPKTAAAIELNRLFSLKINNDVHLAGVEGFEPPNAWTKTMCLTTWRHPKALLV